MVSQTRTKICWKKYKKLYSGRFIFEVDNQTDFKVDINQINSLIVRRVNMIMSPYGLSLRFVSPVQTFNQCLAWLIVSLANIRLKR